MTAIKQPVSSRDCFKVMLCWLLTIATIVLIDWTYCKGGTLVATATATATAAAATTSPVIGKVYYVVGASGNDANDGSSAHPWKSLHVVDNATVMCSGTFHQTIVLGGHSHAVLDGQDKTTIVSSYCVQWKDGGGGVGGGGAGGGSASHCTLRNVVLTSDDGNGLGGNVYGDSDTLDNVNLGNLSEGFDYLGPVTNLTITGGGQVGLVKGRCHFFLNVTGLKWVGDPTKHWGYATQQSPIRFSSPIGVVNGTINGVIVTQAKSPFPIACWAVHCAKNVTWTGCTSDSGEFSFNSAGDVANAGTVDVVSGCSVVGLQTINTKVSLQQNVAVGCHFIGGHYVNPTGECVAVGCAAKAGNTFEGMTLESPRHGFHFYTGNDTKISRVTVIGPAKTPIMDGAVSKENDGGGNVLKQR